MRVALHLVYAQTMRKILQSFSMNMNAMNLKSSGNTTRLQKNLCIYRVRHLTLPILKVG